MTTEITNDYCILLQHAIIRAHDQKIDQKTVFVKIWTEIYIVEAQVNTFSKTSTLINANSF